MKKQTKLVAEEDGTWVYYDRNGDKVTDKWAKSGNNWYYLDSNGEMAVDQLIEDGDNYYYVDVNGVMAANQWVAIDNEDAGDDDEPEHYWYYFQANGKALKQGDSDTVSLKTVNGKKYAFDEYGAMVAEWSLDEDDLGTNPNAFTSNVASSAEVITGKAFDSKYTESWKYFNSVEDGARVSKGWFKVVPAEMLNSGKYDDDEDAWYYADGSGNLYAGEFKTIKGKKYAFRDDGRMLNGLKFIKEDEANQSLSVYADDHDTYNFDNEDDFLDHAAEFYEPNGYKCFYFGDEDDGAMRTNKTNVEIDGENHNFYFEKSGGHKGAGVTGEEDDKLYQSGMLLKADSDDKYIVVDKATKTVNGKTVVTYNKLDDAKDFMDQDDVVATNLLENTTADTRVNIGNNSNKKAEDLTEAYKISFTQSDEDVKHEYVLVNTSGKVIDSKGKNKDGNDYYYVTDSKGVITNVYVEN